MRLSDRNWKTLQDAGARGEFAAKDTPPDDWYIRYAYHFDGAMDRAREEGRRAALADGLRDAFAVQATQAALADALRSYGHICPTVIQNAAALAYEVADGMIAYGARHSGETSQ